MISVSLDHKIFIAGARQPFRFLHCWNKVCSAPGSEQQIETLKIWIHNFRGEENLVHWKTDFLSFKARELWHMGRHFFSNYLCTCQVHRILSRETSRETTELLALFGFPLIWIERYFVFLFRESWSSDFRKPISPFPTGKYPVWMSGLYLWNISPETMEGLNFSGLNCR